MDRGIIDIPSSYSVPETLARAEALLKEKGFLQQWHGTPADLMKNIAGVGALLEKAVE